MRKLCPLRPTLPGLHTDADYQLRLRCAYSVIANHRGKPEELLHELVAKTDADAAELELVIGTLLRDVNWGVLEELFGRPVDSSSSSGSSSGGSSSGSTRRYRLDAEELLRLDANTVEQRLQALLNSGCKDNYKDDRTVQRPIDALRDAFNLFGRNKAEEHLVELMVLRGTVRGPAVDVRNPMQGVRVDELKRIFHLRRRGYRPDSDCSGSTQASIASHTSKDKESYCPPIGLGLAGAMLVQVANEILDQVRSLQHKPLGSGGAKTLLHLTQVLRDIQLSLMLGNRSQSEVFDMQRYQQVFVLLGDQRVTLRALQLAGMDICMAYLQAGLPVFFQMWQGKSQLGEHPYTFGVTMKPDELSLFCPVVGTLLHYQVFDMVAHLTKPGDVKPEWEFPVRPKNGLSEIRHRWCHGDKGERGVALEPVLKQLYGWKDPAAMAANLNHSPYAGRYALQASMAHMGCSPAVIADIVGHRSIKSQEIYKRNPLRARATLPDGTVGYMLPAEVAESFFKNLDGVQDIMSASTLCSLRCTAGSKLPTCAAVEVDLVARELIQALGEQRGTQAVPLIRMAKEEVGAPQYTSFPCVPLRLDGWANFAEVLHRMQDGRPVDVTPESTQAWLKQQMDRMHALQGVAVGEPKWTLPSVAHLLGTFMRPLLATRVTLCPWPEVFQEVRLRKHLASAEVELQVEQTQRAATQRAYEQQRKAVATAHEVVHLHLQREVRAQPDLQHILDNLPRPAPIKPKKRAAAPVPAVPAPAPAPAKRAAPAAAAPAPSPKKPKPTGPAATRSAQVEFSLSVKGQAYFWQAKADMHGDTLVALHDLTGSKVELLHDACAKLQGMDLGAWKLVQGKVRKNGHFWLI